MFKSLRFFIRSTSKPTVTRVGPTILYKNVFYSIYKLKWDYESELNLTGVVGPSWSEIFVIISIVEDSIQNLFFLSSKDIL